MGRCSTAPRTAAMTSGVTPGRYWRAIATRSRSSGEIA
jgi:hypothetical protein